MKVNGEELKTLEVYKSMLTVPDCNVVRANKIGTGNGEKKLYIGSKDEMHLFFGPEHFCAKCFMLKKDLQNYLLAIENEYKSPSQNYAQKENFPTLWAERFQMVSSLPEVICFSVEDQSQIEGPRGYVNSDDDAYNLIRIIALPLISYIYIEKVGLESDPLFYWKLFVDYEAIWETQNGPLVFKYGKRDETTEQVQLQQQSPSKEDLEKKEHISQARNGQGKYRLQLLNQCRFCPISMLADERLLIASHIKPWASSNDDEKIDPFNGYILSPLYDKLFDQGFITFTPQKHVILSEFLSPYTWKQIGLTNNTRIDMLPMDDKRIEYLKFHHQSVFKGSYEEEE